MWTAFDRVTAYVSHEDRVLSAATSLFGSSRRLGQLEPEDVKEKIESGRWDDRNVDLVFYDAEKGGFASSHAYYLTPAVGADLVLLIRGHAPGAENGRPLEKVDDHLFIIRDDYLK